MTTDKRRDEKSHDDDAHPEREPEKRETGFSYGANEAEQTRERERAGQDRTDVVGEITETELP
jgi:hypothetical protein